MAGYKPHRRKDETKPLSVSSNYREMEAAHFWGKTPEEFERLSMNDKAKMLAFFVVNREIESYYASESMKKMDKDRQEAESRNHRNRR